jgi:drug/metabolite transporter (DMT)-like permease
MSVIFYSMPIWLSLGAHFLIPGERMSRRKALGLALRLRRASPGRSSTGPAGQGEASLAGDLCALGAAIGWAGIGLTLRATAIREANGGPAPVAARPLGGGPDRARAALRPAPAGPRADPPLGLAFQIVVIAFAAFIFWLWLMSIYPASSVAAFSFLGPVFGVFFGWLLLGESIGLSSSARLSSWRRASGSSTGRAVAASGRALTPASSI